MKRKKVDTAGQQQLNLLPLTEEDEPVVVVEETEYLDPDPPELEEAEADIPEKQWYTVSEISLAIEEAFSADPVLGNLLTVRGELSNVKRSSRGHVYFTLKDESASINGVMWASLANKLNFDMEDGLDVFVTGLLELYLPNGTYSVVVKKIEPVGVGALQLAFQKIKEKLEAEGLFRLEYKKPLPPFPRRVGIITSRTGAVIHDMLRVIRRKNPYVSVLLHPVKVQGEGAAADIAEAIEELNRLEYGLDVLIVGRGGGSFEDLFCFSEEPVVRAIFDSRVPVVTGVGHEPDFSLADAAADYSASTPTAAAEAAVPDTDQLRQELRYRHTQLLEWMAGTLMHWEQRFDLASTALIDLQTRWIDTLDKNLAYTGERMGTLVQHRMQTLEQHLVRAASELDAFSPLSTLGRGYSIAQQADGTVISSIKQVKPQDRLQIHVTDGVMDCEVRDVREKRP